MRIFCFLLMIFMASVDSLQAQDLSGDSPWEGNDSPWSNPESQTGPASTGGAGRVGTNTNNTHLNSLRAGTPGKPGPVASPAIQPAPIDGGLVVLLAAGALYGGRRLRKLTQVTA